MSAGVFVLTSPRKTEDPWQYIKALTKHVATEDFPGPKWIVVDGTPEQAAELAGVVTGAWAIERFARPEGMWLGGNKWPYWKLLELALDQVGADGEASVLEDDIEFCLNALTRMSLFPIPPDVDLAQFFSAWVFGVGLAEPTPGLWRTPTPLAGCQAIKFPARTLKKLVAWGKVPEWQKYNESDVALGLAIQRLSMRIGTHMPDIVQHVGDVSVVAHGMLSEAGVTDELTRAVADRSLGGRISINFPGKHFDAMKLFSRHDLYR